jgi:DEAD/DEAH box helicase domain-containing protein
MADEHAPGQLALFAPEALLDDPPESKAPPKDVVSASSQEGTKAPAQHKHYVAFDTETKHSFAEVGGRANMHKLEISVAVSYNSKTDSYTTYRENELEGLVEEMKEAEVVVGFNSIGFDYPVLQVYTDYDLYQLPTLDVMLCLEHSLGYRVSLDKVASATLGTGKSGHGLQAIDWFREGQWELLIKYCRQDVKVTKDVYEFGRDNGFLYIPAAGSRRKVDVRIDG